MVSQILLLVAGAAVISTFASGAQPPQPPRIRTDVLITGFVPCNNGTSMKTGSAPGFPSKLQLTPPIARMSCCRITSRMSGAVALVLMCFFPQKVRVVVC